MTANWVSTPNTSAYEINKGSSSVNKEYDYKKETEKGNECVVFYSFSKYETDIKRKYIDNLTYISNLKDNWDGYSSCSYDKDFISELHKFLSLMLKTDYFQYQFIKEILPCPIAGEELEIDIEFENGKELSIHFHDKDDISFMIFKTGVKPALTILYREENISSINDLMSSLDKSIKNFILD